MKKDRRGVRNVRTLSGLLDGRRARTSAGALLELSSLANERQRLRQELERWQRRQVEIEARLAEIAAKEQRLRTFVETGGSVPVAQPLPIAAPPLQMSARELTY